MRRSAAALAILLLSALPAAGVEPVLITLPAADETMAIALPGAFPPSTEIAIPFRLETGQGRPLTVRAEMTGCRCAVAAGGSGELAAGRPLLGTMTMHSAAWHGTLGGTLVIAYAEGTAPPRRLSARVRVEIADLLANSPDVTGVFRVADLEQGTADDVRTFVIERGGYPEAFATVAAEPDPAGRVRVAVTPLDRDRWTVAVGGLAALPAGSLAVPIRFRFRTAAGALLERSVERRMCLRIHGVAKAVPREVLFGELDARAAPVEAVVAFRATADRDAGVEVRGWTVDHPALVAVAAAAPGAISLRFHDFAALPTAALDAVVNGNVLVRLVVGAREAELNVPYVAVVRRRSLAYVPVRDGP